MWQKNTESAINFTDMGVCCPPFISILSLDVHLIKLFKPADLGKACLSLPVPFIVSVLVKKMLVMLLTLWCSVYRR